MAPLSPQLQKCELERLLNHDVLPALFQPIAAQGGQDIVAYEGQSARNNFQQSASKSFQLISLVFPAFCAV